jgi:hypothetical protein
MPEFNVADGSVAAVPKDGSPLAMIKGYQDNTWFYAPRAARISTRSEEDREPMFVVVRNRKHADNGQGLETLGGVFACQLELNVPLPTMDIQGQWTEHIGLTTGLRPAGNGFRFQPMRLRDGVMSVQGIDAFVVDPKRYQNIRVGATSTIPITLELNKLGADTFASAFGAHQTVALPVTAAFTFKYDLIVPNCHYKITADGSKVYDFFSYNVKARASYWGLVGAQADIGHTREELQASGAIRIEQISAPQGIAVDRIKQLEGAIIDSWVKQILAKITEKPVMDPAQAPDPSGFFGGVSVSMKSRTEVQNISLSAEFNYSEIQEEVYNLSYTFGPLLSLGRPDQHLLDVTDDNKLPIVVNMGKDPLVHQYSGQFGYRKANGVFVSNSITGVRGVDGGILTGVIQFAQDEPMPETTEVQLGVDWEEPTWEDRVEKEALVNNESGAAKMFSPGNNIARVKVISNLEKAAADTIAVINYKTVLPDYDGRPVKVYSGSIVMLGQGSAGQIKVEEIAFPYYAGTQNQGKLVWDVTIDRPDGTTVTKSGEMPVTQAALVLTEANVTRGVRAMPTDPRARLLRVLSAGHTVRPITYPPTTPVKGNGTADGVGDPPPASRFVMARSN